MTDIIFPVPDLDDGPLAIFWQKAQHNELWLPQCENCGRIDWYPTETCRSCASKSITWQRLSGEASLFSWAQVRRPLDRRLAPIAPYTSAIVTLAEDPQSRLVTRLVCDEDGDCRIGMPLSAYFADLGFPAIETGIIAPFFRWHGQKSFALIDIPE